MKLQQDIQRITLSYNSNCVFFFFNDVSFLILLLLSWKTEREKMIE